VLDVFFSPATAEIGWWGIADKWAFATGGFLYSRQVRRKAIKKLSLSKSPKERGQERLFYIMLL